MENETNETEAIGAFFGNADKRNQRQYQIPYVQWIDDIGKDPYLLQNKSAKAAIAQQQVVLRELPKYVIPQSYDDVGPNSLPSSCVASSDDSSAPTSKYSLMKTRWGNDRVAKLDLDGFLIRVYTNIQLISLRDIIIALEQKTGDRGIAMKIAKKTQSVDFQREVMHHLTKHNMPPMIETDQGIVVTKYLGLELISAFNKDFRDIWVDQFFDGSYMENRKKIKALNNQLAEQVGSERMKAINNWIKNDKEWESVREAGADADFVNRRAEMLTRLLATNGIGRKFRDELEMLGKWYKVDEQLTNNLIKMFQ